MEPMDAKSGEHHLVVVETSASPSEPNADFCTQSLSGLESPKHEEMRVQEIPPNDEVLQTRMNDGNCSRYLTWSFVKAHMLQVYQHHHFNFALYFLACFFICSVMVYLSFFAAKVNGVEVMNFSCRSWGYWLGPTCGLNGIGCRPFETDFVPFRCPTKCTLDGDSNLKVIGTDIYRADSRICKAAIHAGIIGSNGGCGFFRFSGTQFSFVGSSRNGVSTESFNSWFPKSFEFGKAQDVTLCTDLSIAISVVVILMLCGFSFFERSPPLLLFMVLVFYGYWYVALIGQPRRTNYDDIVINGSVEVFLLMAACYCLYVVGPKYVFAEWKLKTRQERMIFWSIFYVLPYMVTIHLNFFAFIPWLNLDLGGFGNSDRETNAWTYVIYSILGIAGLVIAIIHFRIFYQEKKFLQYLSAYAIGIAISLIIWSLFPSTRIHLHHLMLGVLAIPLTRFPKRLTAMIQALAMGLVVQGYTAYGLDPYIVYNVKGSSLPRLPPPMIVSDQISSTSALVQWNFSTSSVVVGYSLLLNGVEVYRDLGTNSTLVDLRPNTTYYVNLAPFGSYGTDGSPGQTVNFTTTPTT